jgi:hypothetical protein
VSELQKDIESAINRHSAENGSNTPDFILAQYLVSCLAAFDAAVNRRSAWYGREDAPGQPDCAPPATPPVLTPEQVRELREWAGPRACNSYLYTATDCRVAALVLRLLAAHGGG